MILWEIYLSCEVGRKLQKIKRLLANMLLGVDRSSMMSQTIIITTLHCQRMQKVSLSLTAEPPPSQNHHLHANLAFINSRPSMHEDVRYARPVQESAWEDIRGKLKPGGVIVTNLVPGPAAEAFLRAFSGDLLWWQTARICFLLIS